MLITLPCLYTTLHTLPGKQRHRLQGQACSNLNYQQPVQGTSQQAPPRQHPSVWAAKLRPKPLSSSMAESDPKTQKKQSGEWDVDWSKHSAGTQIMTEVADLGAMCHNVYIHLSVKVYAACIGIGDS